MGQSELRDAAAAPRAAPARPARDGPLPPLGAHRCDETAGLHPPPAAGRRTARARSASTTTRSSPCTSCSGGIPRLVNLICDRALLAGYVRKQPAHHAADGATGREGGPRRAAPRAAARPPRPGRGGPHARPRGAGVRARPAARTGARCRRRAASRPADGARPRPRRRPLPPRSHRLDALVRELPARGLVRRRRPRASSRSGGGCRSRGRRCGPSSTSCARSTCRPRSSSSHPARRDTCFAALVRLDERAAVVALGGEHRDRGTARAARRPLDPGRGRVVAGRDRRRARVRLRGRATAARAASASRSPTSHDGRGALPGSRRAWSRTAA